MRHLALVAVVLLASSCGATEEGPPSAQAPTSPQPSPSETETMEEASPLEGTWQTGTVTEADIEATLKKAGLERWIKPLRELPAEHPPTESNVFILEIGEGGWDLSWESNGGPAEELDYDAAYAVDGDTVEVSHEGDHNTYRWSVDGDTLTLTWLETTYPDYEGIPEQVLQTAFYMSGTFRKGS